MTIRIGNGFDVHALVAGRKLVLGGVTIPYERGLEGHSDADVLLHAVADAILGALAQGDIGTHFPDTDARWKGADSRVLGAEARAARPGDAREHRRRPRLRGRAGQHQGDDDRAARLRGSRRGHRRARDGAALRPLTGNDVSNGNCAAIVEGRRLSSGPQMKRCCALALFLVLGGCFPIAPVQMYLPTDVPSVMLGGCPSVYEARLLEQDGVALDLLVRPTEGSTTPFKGEFWLGIPRGRSASILKDYGMTIRGLSSSEALTPYLDCIDPRQGPPFTRCRFTTNLSNDKEFVVQFPPIEINGSRYDVNPMRFSLQKRPAVCWTSA